MQCRQVEGADRALMQAELLRAHWWTRTASNGLTKAAPRPDLTVVCNVPRSKTGCPTHVTSNDLVWVRRPVTVVPTWADPRQQTISAAGLEPSMDFKVAERGFDPWTFGL